MDSSEKVGKNEQVVRSRACPGLAEIAVVREDSMLMPDRLVIAKHGERGHDFEAGWEPPAKPDSQQDQAKESWPPWPWPSAVADSESVKGKQGV